MRCKSFLTILTLSLSFSTGFAQSHQDWVNRRAGRTTKVDTIVVGKGTKAQNAVPTTECVVPGAKDIKPGYKPIPLMGQKSYFGDQNDYVTSFVQKYFDAHNKTLNVVQDRGTTSFSIMDNILQKNDIPKELKYLAVIESALNHNAVSHAGAVGPWQLMASTARLMGLTVNRRHDDRRDWDKSTNAAAKYLSILYGQLNDWLLVIAAYNSGPAPVQRAIQRTGSHNFWDIKKYLPRETQGHVLAFIATASIFEKLNKFIGIGELPIDFSIDETKAKEAIATEVKKNAAKTSFTPEELKNMAIIQIKEPLSMDLMARELNVDEKLLAKWNPDYDLFIFDSYPTKDYSLRIPKDKVDNFLAKKDVLAKRSRQIFNDMKM